MEADIPPLAGFAMEGRIVALIRQTIGVEIQLVKHRNGKVVFHNGLHKSASRR